jgi:hypothetical protein
MSRNPNEGPHIGDLVKITEVIRGFLHAAWKTIVFWELHGRRSEKIRSYKLYHSLNISVLNIL